LKQIKIKITLNQISMSGLKVFKARGKEEVKDCEILNIPGASAFKKFKNNTGESKKVEELKETARQRVACNICMQSSLTEFTEDTVRKDNEELGYVLGCTVAHYIHRSCLHQSRIQFPQYSCPTCKQFFFTTGATFVPLSNEFKDIVFELKNCSNEGCGHVYYKYQIPKHEAEECNFRRRVCMECGFASVAHTFNAHSCVNELKGTVVGLKAKVTDLEGSVRDLKTRVPRCKNCPGSLLEVVDLPDSTTLFICNTCEKSFDLIQVD
jgi:hypothetical protein